MEFAVLETIVVNICWHEADHRRGNGYHETEDKRQPPPRYHGKDERNERLRTLIFEIPVKPDYRFPVVDGGRFAWCESGPESTVLS